LRGRIGEHGAADALRSVRHDPEPDHAALRQAEPMGVLDPEPIEDRQGVAAEPFDRIGSLAGDALAVATRIVADNTKMLEQSRHLPIPEMQIGGERV
jgi:hypothetical protein